MKNGIYRLVYVNDGMMEIVLEAHLADIDYKTSDYESEKELLKEYGYSEDGQLRIVGNKGLNYYIPIIYDNINVRRVAASSLGKVDVDVLKKEVSDIIQKVRDDALLHQFLIKNHILDSHTGIQIDRYKKYRDIAYYYDVYSSPSNIHSFIITYIFSLKRIEEIKKIVDFVFALDEQTIYDMNIVQRDEDNKIFSLLTPDEMLDRLLEYKHNFDLIRHDPYGMMSGNMTGIKIPEFNPDGSMVKKRERI